MTEYILDGNFKKAEEEWLNLDSKIFFNQMTTLGENTNNISVLFFLQYLDMQQKIADSSELISTILISTFAWLPGSYYLSYEYHKKAVRESPENMELLSSSLNYYSSPDYEMTSKEAHEIATKLKNNNIVNDEVKDILSQKSNDDLPNNASIKFNYDEFLHDITDIDFNFDEALQFVKAIDKQELVNNLIKVGKETKKYGVVIFTQYLDMIWNNEFSNNLIISVLNEAYNDLAGVDYLVSEYMKRYEN